MTGIPVSTGGPPKGVRPELEQAFAAAQSELAPPPQEEAEIQQRIVRLEEVLLNRGIITQGDLTGPAGTDDMGNPLPPPEAVDPAAAAGGAPPPQPPV